MLQGPSLPVEYQRAQRCIQAHTVVELATIMQSHWLQSDGSHLPRAQLIPDQRNINTMNRKKPRNITETTFFFSLLGNLPSDYELNT